MNRRGVSIRDVEVRTWPQRVDVLVIDPYEAVAIAHYPYREPGPGKVADLTCGYEERASRALRQLEADQDYLHGHFRLKTSEEVRLRAIDDVRKLMAELLAEHDLTLDDVEMPNLTGALSAMRTMPIDQLYQLMCDWHDVVERHLFAGYTARDTGSWVHRAAPDVANHFHYLASGVERRGDATDIDTADAYDLFQELVDVELASFTLGHAIRWVYFHRTEFDGFEPFKLRALAEAGV